MIRLIPVLTCLLFFAFHASAQDPEIKFSGPTSFCEGQSLVLTSTGAEPGSSYKWRRDGIVLPNETSSSYTAKTSGTFDVVISKANVHDTLAGIKITVNPNPVSSFNASASNLCANLPVAFTNTSQGTALGYAWDFGDENSGTTNTSDIRNASHVFIGTPGNGTESFTVKLTVTDNKGCSNSSTKQVTVKQIPDTKLGGTGAITYNDLPYFTQCNSVASDFTFTNLSSTGSTNTHYQIKWGDAGADFSSENFTSLSHTYNVGTNKLQFIVSGNNGCKDTALYHVFVGSNPAVGLGNPGNTIICTGISLTFPISNTESNPPGTVYTASFNDGTSPVSYNHPAPVSVTHRFDEGSCGVSSNGFANSFLASIVASNPCGISAANVVPIYVSKKAVADFSISPNDTTCVNTEITLRNTGISGNSVTGLGHCNEGKAVWKITPATGWSLVSGSTGNDFNLNDPASWLAGSNALQVKFTLPGVYKIKMRSAGSTLCGDDEIEKIICVNPIPVASFTTNLAEGCLPLTVTTTNTSNTPNCGENSYNWSVEYANNTSCTATSDYSFINNTSATSVSPQFQFKAAGVYTIRLITTNKSAGCTSVAFSRQITVKARPVVNINATAVLCQQQTIRPAAIIQNCFTQNPPTYEWTFPGGQPASSTSADPGEIRYSTPGSYSITLKVTNECGTTTATKQVTVNPVPAITIPPNRDLCAGETSGVFNFTQVSPGATITWTNSNSSIGLASNGSGNIPSFTANSNGVNAVTATIDVKGTLNGCHSPSQTFTLTVHPRPPVLNVVSPVNYCVGETATPLESSPAPGHSLLWYTSNTNSPGSTQAPVPATNVSGSMNYYVSQVSNSSGCESVTSLIQVNVQPTPAITNAEKTDPGACAAANGSISLKGLVPNTSYTVRYARNATPVVTTLSSNSAGVLIISGLTAGTYAEVIVEKNGCASNKVGPFVLNDPDPPALAEASANGPLCTGATLELNASTSSTGSIVYSWSGPNQFSSTVQNPKLTDVSSSAAGNYTVTITRNGCSVTRSVGVIIHPKPQKPSAIRPVEYCLGAEAIPLSATTTSGHTLNWYNNPQLNNGSVSAPTPSTLVAGTINYYLTQENTFGCTSDTIIIPVIVHPKTSGNSIGADQTICAGQTAQILKSVLAPQGGDGHYTYQWQFSTNDGNEWTDIPEAVSETFSPGAVQSTRKFRRLVRSAGCDVHISNEISIIIQGSLGDFDINSSQTICAGQTPALLKGQQPVGGSGSYIYQWEQSTDQISWSVISGAEDIEYQPAALSVTHYYRRKVSSGSCSAYSSVATITVIDKPVMTDVPDITYCSGSTGGNISFTSNVSSNIVYSWVNDNPSIGLAASGTGDLPSFTTINDLETYGLRYPVTARITVTPAYVDGNLHCQGDPVQFTITVLPYLTPRQNADIPVCSGVTIPSHRPVSGAGDFTGSAVHYKWTVAGNAIDLTDGTGTIVPAYTAFNNTESDQVSVITLTAVYTLNGVGCEGGPMSYSIVVKPSVTNNNISGDQDICVDTDASLLQGTVPAGGNGGYKFQWQSSTDGGNTWTDIQGAIDQDYYPGTMQKTMHFRRNVSTAMCAAPSASNAVAVNVGADAKASFVATKDTACAPFILDAQVIAVQQFSQNTSYNWYANGDYIGSGANFPGFIINNAHDSVSIKLVAGSGCKSDSIEHKFFTHLTPVPSFSLSEESGCGPMMVVVNNSTPDASLFNFHWDFGNGQTSTAVQPGSIVFAPNPNYGDSTYIVKLNTGSVCEVKQVTQSVLVKSKPKALFTPNMTVGCSPMTVVFSNTSAGIGNSYDWDFGDGTTLKSDDANVSHVFTTGVRDTFYVKLKAVNSCGEDGLQYAIVVSPNTIKLDFAVNGNEETGCAPHATRFINNSKGASSFTWDFGDGQILNTQKNIDTIRHQFASPGVYNVTLFATNGCSDTSSVERITVFPTPVAAFETVSSCPEDSVRFKNLTQTASSYHWDFGDGHTSNLKDPAHFYAAPGQYTVVLTAHQFNAPGSICSDTLRHIVDLGPSGQFSYSTTTSCNDNSVTFQVQTANADTLIYEFGDGETLKSTKNTVTYRYPRGGIYTPHVTLLNKSGCSIKLSGDQPIRVDKIDAGFHTVPDLKCGSTTLEFRDTTHAFFGIRSVYWEFGDGTTGVGQVVQHNYNVSGTYPVRMFIEGNSGCTDTLEKMISVVVHAKPLASIRADEISCTGYDISFQADIVSGDAIDMMEWTISNGARYSGNSFRHKFSQAGLYNVQLIVGTGYGCYDTANHDIRIQPSPFVNAGIDQTICLGTSTRLQATASSPIQWLPVEGLNCQDCPNPVAAPLVTTPYVAQATNEPGCSSYDTIIVQVIQPLRLMVSPDDSICTGTSVTLLASGAQSYRWTPAEGLSDTQVPNPIASPTNTTRYQVVGFDGFNCFTDTAYVTVAIGEHPHISLGPDLVLSTGTLQPLTSVIENGPVRTWSWTPSTDLSCDDCPLPVATIKKDITYRVNITTPYGCEASDTLQIKVFCENSQVFIANAFTPDGDGINDVLFVQGKGIAQVKSWRIFNRWGELVFERSNFSANDQSFGWDGKVRGVAGGPDVFVFTAEVICENGTPYQYKGNVSIIK